MTIEASGIAPAIMTGYLMDLPVVFAKKKIAQNNSECAKYHSTLFHQRP